MIFVQDITERFLINVEKIDYIDHKPDGRWYVVVRNRQFEIAEKTLEILKSYAGALSIVYGERK